MVILVMEFGLVEIHRRAAWCIKHFIFTWVRKRAAYKECHVSSVATLQVCVLYFLVTK